MRRVLAATLVLLLTGAPVVAAACALACPMPVGATEAATAVSAGMPADCAAMHHAATPDSTPRTAVDVRHHAPAMLGCCAMTGGPVDEPPASVARHAVGLSVALPPAVVVVSIDTPRVVQRDHLPPSGVPFDRARRTDILRL